MTFAAVGSAFTWDTTPITLVPTGVGNLIVLGSLTKLATTPVLTGISSTNVTWSQLTTTTTGTNSNTAGAIWIGKVTSTSSATVTLTWSGGSAPSFWQIDGREFSSTAGNWALDVGGYLDTNTSNSAYVSLTPAAAGELYFGAHYDNSGSVAGSTSGYTYFVDSHGNGMAFNPNCTSGAQAPTWADTGVFGGPMALIKEVSAGGSSTQTTIPLYSIQGMTASPSVPRRIISSIPQSIPAVIVQNNNIQNYPFALTKPRPLNLIGLARPLVPQNPANIPNVYVQGVTATATVTAQVGAVKTSSIVVTDLTNDSNTLTSTAVTASISPAGNSLLLLWTGAWDGGAGFTTVVNSVTGLGLVWTQLTAQVPGNAKGQLGLWYAITGPNPGSGTVTINLATASAICWDINQVTNVNLASPFVASNTRTSFSSSGNPNVTLNAAANASTNLFMFGDCLLVQPGGSLTQSAAETPPWTVLSSQESNTANNNTACMVQVSPNTTTVLAQSTATVSHSWGTIGIELQAAPPPVFSSVAIPSINPVFRLANKNLRAQNPASIPVVSATPVNINGLTATVNTSSVFGGLAVITQTAALPTHGWPYFSKRYIVAPNKPNVFVAGITSNVNVTASFGTINIFETEATSNVSVAAPFGGSTTVHQTTSMPSHGWPYFSKRYIVAPNKPNVFINGITATVNISSNFGSITVSEAGTVANVNVVAQTGNIGSSAKPATPNVPIASYPFGLIGKTLRQQNQASKPNVYVPGLSTSVAVSASSAFKTYIGSNFTQQFPVTTNVPYPLNVISKLRPQNSYVTSAPPTSVNITGLVATVNVASNFGTIKVTEAGITSNVNAAGSFGSVYIFSPKSVPAPFANSAPYPLNITTKLRPQNTANRVSTIIRGITSTAGVQASFGIVKSSLSATAANVSVAAAIGSVKLTTVVPTTTPRYPVSSYPFNIIGKTLRPQIPNFVNTVHAYAGQVSAETVHAGLGTVTVSVTESKSVNIVTAYPGTVKIGTPPVFSWRGKVMKGPRSKIRLSV